MMTKLGSIVLLTLAASTAAAAVVGCGGGGGSGDPNVVTSTVDPAVFTVSLRNRVRVPDESQSVSADDFVKQLKVRDPVAPIRCMTDESKAFKDASEFLGGIKWSHPVTRIKDSSLPPLYEGRPKPMNDGSSSGGARAEGASAADGSAAPVIERPDLVGIQNGVAIFLSKQHGLLAVDARNPAAPNLSCSMKLPGEPKNFLFKGNEIVVVVNALNGMNRSALLRYALDGTKFRFVDSVNLEAQTIQDARLFDQTIVMYTSWSKKRDPQKVRPYEPDQPGIEYGGVYYNGGGGGGSARESSGAAADMAAPGEGGCYGQSCAEQLGTKVLVVQWDDALAIDWEDSLMNDPPAVQVGEPKKDYKADELISERKSYKTFVAASDRYIAIPRDVETTRFDRYETMTWQECTNYNPRAYQYESCSVQYEQRANPDYRAPNPSTGDYQCNGKNLADCVKEAAPSVSQYIYVPVGRKCEAVWQGRCEKYESRSSTYPTFKTTQETEMTIYRFGEGSFTKLDSKLGKLVEKAGNIAFEQNPLKVTGQIQNRNQIQFQNGHLYVFGDQALQTMAVAGNSVSYLNRLDIPSSTNSNPSIVFSDDRAMISSRNGGYAGSEVTMLDLVTPSFPKMHQSFTMPGQSTQLLLAAGGILGPGQVSFASGAVGRTLQKLTLFSREGGQELDNLLMGTEFDAFEQSWFNTEDDQRIRLSPALNRLFLPYSGRHHAEEFAPTAHRLNVSRIDAGKLVSERSFQVPDEIIRTTSIDDNRSLAFANSAAYLIDRTSGDWAISTLRELFVPFATYRVSDNNDLHVRIDRVGSKCKVTTHKGNGGIFAAEKNDKQAVSELTVTCPDNNGTPLGWKSNIVFNQTRTGVKIGDGGELTEMNRAEVDAIIGAEPPKGFCWLPAGVDPSKVTLINYLDNVPMSAITCEQPKTAAGK